MFETSIAINSTVEASFDANITVSSKLKVMIIPLEIIRISLITMFNFTKQLEKC